MDLSSYCEERMKILSKDLPEEKIQDPVLNKSMDKSFLMDPVELSEDENERMFHDWGSQKIFEGRFDGEGKTYKVETAPNKWSEIKTWSFTDENELTWLIPQWITMDTPQGTFKGFSKEEPGKYIYYIEYLDKVQTKRGIIHDIKVFRKLAS